MQRRAFLTPPVRSTKKSGSCEGAAKGTVNKGSMVQQDKGQSPPHRQGQVAKRAIQTETGAATMAKNITRIIRAIELAM
jgi:hypothetical protein